MAAKVFISQVALDELLGRDAVEISGEVLSFRQEGLRLKLAPGVHFVKVSGDGPDPNGLVGKVKDQEALAQLGGEQYMNSVILGETAYDVAPGFLAVAQEPTQGGAREVAAALKASSVA